MIKYKKYYLKKSNTYNNTVTSKNKRYFAQYLWDYLEKYIVIQGQTTIHEVSSPGKKANKTTPPLPLGAFCHITEQK